MTKKQREDLQRRQARLAQMGIQVGGDNNNNEGEKKKRVVSLDRKGSCVFGACSYGAYRPSLN